MIYDMFPAVIFAESLLKTPLCAYFPDLFSKYKGGRSLSVLVLERHN